MAIFNKLFQKLGREETIANSFCEALIITLITKTKPSQKKKGTRPISSVNVDVKISRKYQETKSIYRIYIYHDQVGFNWQYN